MIDKLGKIISIFLSRIQDPAKSVRPISSPAHFAIPRPAPATLLSRMPGKSRVSYFYDADVGNYYYGAGHPMLAHCHCLCSRPDYS